MNPSLQIEAKLVGSEQIKQRRAELLAELNNAYAEGGSQAVTNQLTERMDNIVDAFDGQLLDLKKQL